MKKNFLLLVMALVAVYLLQGHAVASAQSWTYPGEVAERPYYEGLGTEESPYLINSAQQLANLAWYVNNGTTYEGVCFALTADIDLNPGFTFNADGTVTGDGQPQAWVPIGHDWNYGIQFMGKFDGRGHTVSGLYLDLTYQGNGLFGSAKNAEFKNLNITNSLATCESPSEISSYVGFVVGWLENGSIADCKNSGSIYRDATSLTPDPFSFCTMAGGIAGYLWSTVSVTGCSNSGSIRCESIETGYTMSTTSLGGIVGYWSSGENKVISDCTNSGSIYSSGVAGGIVGYASLLNGVAERLSNTSDINGVFGSGGIFGAGDGLDEVSECTNSGYITAHKGNIESITEIGGIAGRLGAYELSHCVNTGTVDLPYSGSNISFKTGGLVGYLSGADSINDCRNEGHVTGMQTIGGLFGSFFSSGVVITDCHNSGIVESKEKGEMPFQDHIGGLIGNGWEAMGVRMLRCSNEGGIDAREGCFACGLGNMDVKVIDSCYNTGNVTGSYSYGLVSGTVDSLMNCCYNTGDIVGLYMDGSHWSDPTAAGLANTVRNRIQHCYNSGNISSGRGYSVGYCYTAGLCLNLYDVVAEQCYNDGIIAGGGSAGGLFGLVSAASISNCYNAGDVSGIYVIGGVASFYNGYEGDENEITNTFSYGKVEVIENENISETFSGSFIGYISTYNGYGGYFKVTNSFYLESGVPGVGENGFADIAGLTACTEDDFSSGRICVLLNGDQVPAPWGQDVGTDAYPLLNGGGNPDVSGIGQPETPDVRRLEGLPVYNLQGVRVYAPLKSLRGIYIVGGRKVLLP